MINPVTFSAPLSPLTTNPATGRQYLLLHNADWTQAEQWARSMGGHLATVRDQAEQDWIYGTFGSYGGFSKLLWIGLNDRAREEKFVWFAGDATLFTHWASGEPNGSGSENFVAMYYPGHSQQARWNDWSDRLTDPIGIPFHGVVELVPGASALLVPAGAIWKYHDTGQNLGVQWRALDYNDGNWFSGQAPLGYGDGDEATLLNFGSDPNNKPVTTYFRRTFLVNNFTPRRGLVLSILRDDGAVVYLNGMEVLRHNLPEGDIAYDTLALTGVPAGDESTHFHSLVLDPNLLALGPNVLAVEIHQVTRNSQDISFNLQLLASRNLPPTVNVVAPWTDEFVGVPRPLQIRAVAEDDESVAQVSYYRNDMVLGTVAGAALDMTIPDFRGGLSRFFAVATDNQGLSSTSTVVTIRYYPGLVPGGSTWSYWDRGTDLGSAWRHDGFDDHLWASGPAPLGFGQGTEATVVSFGPDPNQKPITTYFRTSAFLDNPAEFTRLILRLVRDDGAVVYLNGVEVMRHNLPSAQDILYNTPALTTVSGTDETQIYFIQISPVLLRPGKNQLAVEVHQSDPASSDLRFDLEVLAVPNAQKPVLSLNSSGILSWSLAGATYALETTDALTPQAEWVPFDQPLSLIGGKFQVGTDPGEPQRFFRLKEL